MDLADRAGRSAWPSVGGRQPFCEGPNRPKGRGRRNFPLFFLPHCPGLEMPPPSLLPLDWGARHRPHRPLGLQTRGRIRLSPPACGLQTVGLLSPHNCVSQFATPRLHGCTYPAGCGLCFSAEPGLTRAVIRIKRKDARIRHRAWPVHTTASNKITNPLVPSKSS